LELLNTMPDRPWQECDPERLEQPPLCGRCLFQNCCLRIRLLGLPGGRDLGPCFAGCRGLLTVTHGQIEVQTGDGSRLLREGEFWPLPASGDFHLWTEETSDVVLFEHLREPA
jgi:glyoxylate utilization-related uncharacterized protein